VGSRILSIERPWAEILGRLQPYGWFRDPEKANSFWNYYRGLDDPFTCVSKVQCKDCSVLKDP
jgi:hypothetical protein